MSGEVLVLPAFGQGHLFPCMELCKLISSLNYKTTLVVFPHLSSSVPSTFRNLPLIQVLDIPSPPGSELLPMQPDTLIHFLKFLQNLLSTRPDKPICAIVDVLIITGWSADVFNAFQIPTISFFTSGACSAALEFASWKASPLDISPGETRFLPGLPEQVGLTVSDLKRRRSGGGGGGPPRTKIGGPKGFGLPGPGDFPPWFNDTEGSVALMINTCDDLERPFLDYLTNEVKKPVWGVGPLFPEEYWRRKSNGSQLIHDSEIRTNNKSANVTEENVIQWLDSKSRGSVIYVSFGSSVDLSREEYPTLAEALEESTHPFIWVIRPDAGRSGPPGLKQDPNESGYYPDGMNERIGDRGLIIRGWAPQLLILSHKSTGGFLSHMGWNSTMEGIGVGIPFLAWPLRGDQYYDAKLVVCHLKLGYNVTDDLSEMVKKDDIVKGIDKLMGDKEMKKRAEELGARFNSAASMAAIVQFFYFIKTKLPLSTTTTSQPV